VLQHSYYCYCQYFVSLVLCLCCSSHSTQHASSSASSTCQHSLENCYCWLAAVIPCCSCTAHQRCYCSSSCASGTLPPLLPLLAHTALQPVQLQPLRSVKLPLRYSLTCSCEAGCRDGATGSPYSSTLLAAAAAGCRVGSAGSVEDCK
jgi:hypothetical protein